MIPIYICDFFLLYFDGLNSSNFIIVTCMHHVTLFMNVDFFFQFVKKYLKDSTTCEHDEQILKSAY